MNKDINYTQIQKEYAKIFKTLSNTSLCARLHDSLESREIELLYGGNSKGLFPNVGRPMFSDIQRLEVLMDVFIKRLNDKAF